MPKTTRFLIAALLAVATAAPGLAQSTQNCAPRDVLVERLSGSYGENFSGGGLQNAEAVFEVWTSEVDGTWTILMTRADGVSCIMAAGTDWRKALAREAARGIPS